MSTPDWVVLVASLAFIVGYGVWKTRGSKDVKAYLLANKSAPWYTVALSIMATQASAITFLSTPGQAYVDGMGFLQFYLGLPIAMIILSITAVPLFHRLNVYTAYEYLETRFDLKNRVLGSILFLTQRGLAAGFYHFCSCLNFVSPARLELRPDHLHHWLAGCPIYRLRRYKCSEQNAFLPDDRGHVRYGGYLLHDLLPSS